MKKELLWVPIFGPYCLALGMIAIDRKRGVTAIKKLTTKSKAILNSGRSIIIFPEGTRVKTGESPKLRGGIKSIHAIAPETPIIPVAVHSGSSLPKGSFTIIPGKISIHFLPPLEAVTPDTLLTSLHKAINTNCEL